MGNISVKLNNGTMIDVSETISQITPTSSAVEVPKSSAISNQKIDFSKLKNRFQSMLDSSEGKDFLSEMDNAIKTAEIRSHEGFIFFLKNVFSQLIGPISFFIDQWAKEIVEISKTALKVLVFFGFLNLIVVICVKVLPTITKICRRWLGRLQLALASISFANLTPATELLNEIVIL